MDAARWRQTRATFDELVDLPPTEQAERLAALGAADPELRDAVLSLLAADARSSSGIGPPAAEAHQNPPEPRDPFGLVGRVIAHFRVLEPLGAGGMGVLYRAEDTRLGRTVALKFLLPHLTLDPSAKARFLHEARSAATLDHPNLCTIHEVGESEDGRLFLAMPLYPGETLKARLAREGALPINQAVQIARQTAEGLMCAHAAGIVHRDLKPGNLMLLPDGTVKVLDFGLAKSPDLSLTGSGAALGTVAYMAPEQISGGPVDGRTDLWAVGVVLYEILTGRKPFGGANEAATAHSILHEEPVPARSLRSEITPGVEELIAFLLTKDPRERSATAAGLARALADSEAAGARVRRPPRRPSESRLHRAELLRLVPYLIMAAVLAVFTWVAGTAPPAGAEPLNPRRVVVSPFVNRTGDPSLDVRGQMAAHWITLGLTEHSIADVAGFSLDDQPVRTGAMLRELAEETGAGLVVSGSYHREGDDLLVIARITDATSGTVLREMGPFRGAARGSLAELEQLRDEVLGALALHLDPASPLEAVVGLSAPSFEAYQAYLEGLAALQRSNFPGWMEGTRRALALDSTFLQITGELTWAYVGMGECAPIDSIRRAMQIRRDRVPETVRLEVEQTHALCQRDYEASVDAGKRWLRLSPHSTEAQMCLAFAGIWAGRLRESEALFRNIDLTRGLHAASPFTEENYVEVLHLLDRNEEAVQVAERARERHPYFYRRFYFGLASLAALGRVSEMEARMLEARNTIRPGGGADSYRDMADELLWHGHEAAARQFAIRALHRYEQLPDSLQRIPFYRVARAGALLHLERWEEMRAAVDSVSLPEGSWLVGTGLTANQGKVLALRGIAAAKSGDPAGARAAITAIRQLPDDEGPHYYKTRELWEAQVLVALGEKQRALQRLRDGQNRGGLPRSDPRITHDEAGFRDLWHDPEFEALFAGRPL